MARPAAVSPDEGKNRWATTDTDAPTEPASAAPGLINNMCKSWCTSWCTSWLVPSLFNGAVALLCATTREAALGSEPDLSSSVMLSAISRKRVPALEMRQAQRSGPQELSADCRKRSLERYRCLERERPLRARNSGSYGINKRSADLYGSDAERGSEVITVERSLNKQRAAGRHSPDARKNNLQVRSTGRTECMYESGIRVSPKVAHHRDKIRPGGVMRSATHLTTHQSIFATKALVMTRVASFCAHG